MKHGNDKMSSYYSEAELAEQQRQRLLAQLSKEIEDNRLVTLNLQTSLNSYILSSPTFTESRHSTIAESGDSSNKIYQHHRTHQSDSIKWEKEDRTSIKRTADFSSVLQVDNDQSQTILRHQQKLEQMIMARAILSRNDLEEKEVLLDSITDIITNPAFSMEDKIELTEKKASVFLQRGKLIKDVDFNAIKHDYATYLTLCRMLAIEPSCTFHEEIKKEIQRLNNVLANQREQKYIFDTIKEIMASEGSFITSTTVLSEVSGIIFSVNGSKLCDVFVGVDGKEVLFEPVIDDYSSSVDSKRRANEDIKHVCGLYQKIARKAFEKGIILKTLVHESSSADSCYKKSDFSIQQKEDEAVTIIEEKQMEV